MTAPLAAEMTAPLAALAAPEGLRGSLRSGRALAAEVPAPLAAGMTAPLIATCPSISNPNMKRAANP
jgi:hypothetical protein